MKCFDFYLFKKELWRKHWKFIASSAALVATILSFGTNFLGVLLPTLQGWKESFGSNDEKLVAIRSRLRPIVPWTQISGQQEQAVLQVRLRNYGDTPVLLTSADIELQRTRLATIGSGGVSGRCVLSAVPNENRPIALQPGAEKWVTISPAVRLPGISKWFTLERTSGIHLMPEDKPISIHEGFYVDELNTALADLFGADAVVDVVLYTNVRKKIRKLAFPLAKGKDIFARDGSLMHDSFIAAWIDDKSAPLFLGGEDCSEDL